MRRRATPTAQVLLPLSFSLFVLAFPSTALAQGKPLIDTRSTTTTETVSMERLQDLPTPRDPWTALEIAPGVQAGTPERPLAMTVSGDALISIDGVVIGDAAALGNSGTYTTFDFIEEVQVQTGGPSAEYGRSGGGVINVVTKGGTNEWRGSGRFITGGGDPYDLRTVPDPRILIDILESAPGQYCVNGVQGIAGGNPPSEGAGGPIQFGFDTPLTIGVGRGSGTTYGAGESGNLNLAQIPGCDGQPNGLVFVDALAPVTPPLPTHLFLGQNGAYLVDMGRIGARYGIPDRGRLDYKLDDAHLFSGGFYQAGLSNYSGGGFRATTDGSSTAGGNSVFLYGADFEDVGDDWTPRAGVQYSWDSSAIRVGDPPIQMPDINGDGKPDTVFLPLAMLEPVGQGAIGGGFRAGASGAGGGTLVADSTWTTAADAAGVRGMLENFFSNYEIGEFTIRPKPDAATNGDAGLPNDLGGPIIKDRLWFFGSYGQPSADDEDDDAPLFSEAFYESRPDYAQLFQPAFFTQGSVQRAPGGRGVQGVGLEIDGQPHEIERGWLGGDRYAPGGALEGIGVASRASGLRSLANALDSPLLYVVAQGGPTGEVFRVRVVQPESGPVEIDGLLAVEPVAATAEDRARFERELAELPGERYAMTAAGYCLEMDALAPPAGTVYRVAPAEKQAAFAPMRRALDAARRLRDAGQLHPDSDPTDYYHAIRQWAVWTVEKGFDREGFLDAFVERTEKNFKEAGQPWSAETAAAVRTYGEGRWSDIRAILEAADAP